MAKSHKWLDEFDRTTNVGAAAVRTLNSRLRAVEQTLPKAVSRDDETGELIHQLRVATRRATAALKLYREVLPHHEAKWLRKQLRKLRHASGRIRDVDVLLLGKGPLAELPGETAAAHLREERRLGRADLAELAEHLEHHRKLRRHRRRLLRELRIEASEAREQLFADWAPGRLKELVEQFFDTEPRDFEDVDALHQFRIAGKELRDGIELLVAAFPERLRTEVYPVVERLQDHLGRIHDGSVAGERLDEWADEMPDAFDAAQRNQLQERQDNCLSESLECFRSWWTPEAVQQLRRTFDELTQGTTISTG